ncbi:uncharacterized protein BKA78DRAFT_50494 [Phyllosticta capitalensis]|uniref:uncharacterized protein n=1 Tax=Phyllosticta capitalensis TaxID=121624 RepID=UPI003131B3E5
MSNIFRRPLCLPAAAALAAQYHPRTFRSQPASPPACQVAVSLLPCVISLRLLLLRLHQKLRTPRIPISLSHPCPANPNPPNQNHAKPHMFTSGVVRPSVDRPPHVRGTIGRVRRFPPFKTARATMAAVSAHVPQGMAATVLFHAYSVSVEPVRAGSERDRC